jgi:ubiquinone/menaquinone biosynthesis C-methylase UbiE
MSISTSPFEGTAPYYDKFRAPYPRAAFDFIVDSYVLDGNVRALDLGCGPGTLAIPLSHVVRDVVAVDADPDMLAEGQRLAAIKGLQNITWLRSAAEDLPPTLAPFRVVTLGQSFHWMDRDAVLQSLSSLVENGGGLAILNPGKRRPQESWEGVASQVVTEFLGARSRHPKANPQEPEHEPALLRSASFSTFTSQEFSTEITRDIPSIIGCIYSASSSTKAQFGADCGNFENALGNALLKFNASGVFNERIETEVILAPKKIETY